MRFLLSHGSFSKDIHTLSYVKNKLVGLFPLQTMSVGMLALFTNDTQSYSNIALPSDSPYHHRQSELHNELYFSINIRKNQHHVGEIEKKSAKIVIKI